MEVILLTFDGNSREIKYFLFSNNKLMTGILVKKIIKFLFLKSKNEFRNNTELFLPLVGNGPEGVRSLGLVTGNVSDDLLLFCCLLPI